MYPIVVSGGFILGSKVSVLISGISLIGAKDAHQTASGKALKQAAHAENQSTTTSLQPLMPSGSVRAA